MFAEAAHTLMMQVLRLSLEISQSGHRPGTQNERAEKSGDKKTPTQRGAGKKGKLASANVDDQK